MTTTRRIAAGVAAGTAAVAGGLALFSTVYARRVERRVPADGGFVEIDGVRLHHVDTGAGPRAIVMIHGLAGQLRNFTYALTGRLAGEYRIVVVDRPGSGYSTQPRGTAASLESQAALLARFLERLGLDRPLLVGHSLGGALSLRIALDRPDLVGALALVCPLTQPLDGVPAVFRPMHVPSPLRRWLIAHTLAVPLGRIGQAAARRLVFDPDPVPADFAVRGGGALALRPAAFLTASGEIAAGTGELRGMARRYPTLDLPVGILFGSGDRILSPALHGERTAAAIPGAQLRMIDGGHMLPLTAPDTTAAFVRAQAGRIG